MNPRLTVLLLAVSASTYGCIVPEDASPGVSLGGDLATKFVFRGMTQSENGVFQPRLAVSLPTVTEDSVRLVAKGNMDLSDDNGDAWFPRGHAGKFSQIDFIGSYTRRLGDSFAVEAGLFNYNLPNGLEFANDGQGGPGEERGATSEVFVRVSGDVLGATPYVSWHYDFDEVRGAYYRAGVTETFEINDNWGVILDGSLGYVSSAQADWLYDLSESGLADLRGKAELYWFYDDRTRVAGAVHGSAMMNSTLDRWFNDVGVPDDDPIWFSVGVTWAF
jgi:hypothetical protein